MLCTKVQLTLLKKNDILPPVTLTFNSSSSQISCLWKRLFRGVVCGLSCIASMRFVPGALCSFDVSWGLWNERAGHVFPSVILRFNISSLTSSPKPDSLAFSRFHVTQRAGAYQIATACDLFFYRGRVVLSMGYDL